MLPMVLTILLLLSFFSAFGTSFLLLLHCTALLCCKPYHSHPKTYWQQENCPRLKTQADRAVTWCPGIYLPGSLTPTSQELWLLSQLCELQISPHQLHPSLRDLYGDENMPTSFIFYPSQISAFLVLLPSPFTSFAFPTFGHIQFSPKCVSLSVTGAWQQAS